MKDGRDQMQAEATAAATEMLGSDPSKATSSKMELVQPAPAAMPSEEDGARTIYESNPRNKRWDLLADKVKDRYREQARAVLALFAPVLAEKEREIERACADHANATIGWERERARSEELEARALAAEAALAAERERCAKVAERVGNFGDYKREELTADFGQPRFDMMHEIAAAIRAQGE